MTHTAKPHGGYPVERRGEQPVHHTPHTTHATGKRRATTIDWVTRSGSGTECGKRLHQFAKGSPPHEEIFLFFNHA